MDYNGLAWILGSGNVYRCLGQERDSGCGRAGSKRLCLKFSSSSRVQNFFTLYSLACIRSEGSKQLLTKSYGHCEVTLPHMLFSRSKHGDPRHTDNLALLAPYAHTLCYTMGKLVAHKHGPSAGSSIGSCNTLQHRHASARQRFLTYEYETAVTSAHWMIRIYSGEQPLVT
jgi:hypothetical protein